MMIKEPKKGFKYLYASPELLLSRPEWRATLKSPLFKEKLDLIEIDEAHLVI